MTVLTHVWYFDHNSRCGCLIEVKPKAVERFQSIPTTFMFAPIVIRSKGVIDYS